MLSQKYFIVYLSIYKYHVSQILVMAIYTNFLSSLLLVRSAAGVPPVSPSNR